MLMVMSFKCSNSCKVVYDYSWSSCNVSITLLLCIIGVIPTYYCAYAHVFHEQPGCALIGACEIIYFGEISDVSYFGEISYVNYFGEISVVNYFGESIYFGEISDVNYFGEICVVFFFFFFFEISDGKLFWRGY